MQRQLASCHFAQQFVASLCFPNMRVHRSSISRASLVMEGPRPGTIRYGRTMWIAFGIAGDSYRVLIYNPEPNTRSLTFGLTFASGHARVRPAPTHPLIRNPVSAPRDPNLFPAKNNVCMTTPTTLRLHRHATYISTNQHPPPFLGRPGRRGSRLHAATHGLVSQHAYTPNYLADVAAGPKEK
jgi:hypothetical protein